jgi:DNA-binding CsgD family transcriptional regulator
VLALSLAVLGQVALLQGSPGAVRELTEESLQLLQEAGETWGTALALNFLGRATTELDDPDAAYPLLEESATLFRISGDRQLLAMPLNALGLAALRQGDYTRARAHFEEALAVAGAMDDEQYIAEALTHLGTVALRVNDAQQAVALFQQSLALNRVLDNRDGIAEDLAGVAEVVGLFGRPERAARLFGAVEALREVSGIRLSPVRRAAYDRIIEGIRKDLDQGALVEAWGQGRATPLEQVIEEALEMKDTLPTEASLREAKLEGASSDLLPGAPLPASSPPLSPRRALKQHFGGLTAREREVARLVAQGKANRAIADELVVGVSTVEAHISHIFTKLGFSSRAQIAAWAVAKGLAQAPRDGKGAW